MPFENHLKLRVAERHADGVTVHFPLSPEFLNSQGVLHGGITATIADEAAWHAIENHFGKPTNCTTTELKVNYLRPILGEKAVARAYLVRAGKTLCVSRVDILDDAKQLAAIAIVTYMLL
jgi:acyl-CoA thioesterase